MYKNVGSVEIYEGKPEYINPNQGWQQKTINFTDLQGFCFSPTEW